MIKKVLRLSCLAALMLSGQCKAGSDQKEVLPASAASAVNALLIENIITNTKYHDKIVLDKSAVLIDEYANKCEWSSLFSKGEKILFFYYSNNFCEMCLDQEMQKLKLVPDEYADQVVVLLSVDNNNELKLYKERYKTGFRFYSIGNMELSKNINSLFRPYYFVVDKALNTSMLYIPDKNLAEPSKAYLKEVLGY
ncbi:MAG: hypothetical protein P0Y53_10590 [Candidatus Pseudobacter hemicellulosilyticus]|uniref:Redoxin domain-containing protein n=1 Tax=Candidatus Pseudobacter hemicellulosilyticus TaxID=3121375 RepID=A0AAJ5WWM6_9BACT|nr:MAG: hypothetical protein P0Y53_10590 [Pseudobacter sp.]